MPSPRRVESLLVTKIFKASLILAFLSTALLNPLRTAGQSAIAQQAVAVAREFNFIRRHDLLDQFLAEDAAGKR
jgi:hypothetical protein